MSRSSSFSACYASYSEQSYISDAHEMVGDKAKAVKVKVCTQVKFVRIKDSAHQLSFEAQQLLIFLLIGLLDHDPFPHIVDRPAYSLISKLFQSTWSASFDVLLRVIILDVTIPFSLIKMCMRY
jgi:hypothetical protein